MKKIGTGFLIMGGFVLALSWCLYQVTPIGRLITNAVTLIPEPKIENPIPRCSECVEKRGLSPKCLNVCIQEVILPVGKPTLEFLAGH